MKRTAKRTGLPKRLGAIQAEAERAITRGYRTTLDLLPDAGRAVKRLRGEIEDRAEALSTRGAKAFRAVEKRRQALAHEVEQTVTSLRRSGARALRALDAQRARLLEEIEQRTAQVVRPLAHSLTLATLTDLERLSKRVALLERKRPARRAA